MKVSTSLSSLGLFAATMVEASTFSPARPPAIPLAVKSPYMSQHLTVGSDGGDGGILTGDWPRFWEYSVAGMGGILRVQGKPYCWIGNCAALGYPALSQDAFTYTATKSIFSLSSPEGVGMNVTFMSPIYPNDFKRHSQIATYVQVHLWSIDGAEHDIDLYADISAEWTSGDRSHIAQWEYDVSADGSVATHKVWRQDQQDLTESGAAIAEWGDWLWSTSNDESTTYMSGGDSDVRSAFANNGALPNTKDTDYRAINDRWPVFGFAHDLGFTAANIPKDALFTIGHYQGNAIKFEGAQGIVDLPAYWNNFWGSPEDAAQEFYNDYDYAATAMKATDSKIQNDAVAKGGQDLATIATLAYRQAYGGIQLAGTVDQPYVFLKEISSDGNVGTVDVVFPAFPVFLYDNPEIVKLMLDPLFENQEAGWYPNKWAEHDIGASYPLALGHNDGKDERMSVEEPGNMLIMTLAYAQRANDSAYLTKHYNILKQWNSYLVDAALAPQGDDSLSTDDFAGAADNQTDLALKGIIGIAAMSEIAHLAGNEDDSASFLKTAQDYISQWQELGINKDASPPHTTFSYGNNDSHGLLYNLFADKLLGLKLVPQSVYDMQSDFYPTILGTFGVPLDSRWGWTKLDWEVWAAAYSSSDTASKIYSTIVNWINKTPTNAPLTDLYETEGTGDFASETDANGNHRGGTFAFRPVVGGVFAPLLL